MNHANQREGNMVFWATVGVLAIAAVVAFGFRGFPPRNGVVKSEPPAVVPASEVVVQADSYGLHLAPPGKKISAPAGRQVYQVSQGGNPLPLISETVIDPPAVNPGQMQHLEALVYSPTKLTKVYTVTRLDNSEIKVPLLFEKNETRNGKTYQRFAGDWRVKDTHEVMYETAFFAEDDAGNKNQVEQSWSDACGMAVSGAAAIGFACGGITSTDGVTGYVIIQNGGSLTINAKFVIMGTLTIQGNGTISIGSGGSIEFGNAGYGLFMKDADGDHWPADAYQYDTLASCSATEGAGCVARSTLSTFTTDCNDADASKNSSCAPSNPCGCAEYSPPECGASICYCARRGEPDPFTGVCPEAPIVYGPCGAYC